jgi:hypothetical protein
MRNQRTMTPAALAVAELLFRTKTWLPVLAIPTPQVIQTRWRNQRSSRIWPGPHKRKPSSVS